MSEREIQGYVHITSDSGTGYESTVDSNIGLRRKMESSEDENRKDLKKVRKEPVLKLKSQTKRNKRMKPKTNLKDTQQTNKTEIVEASWQHNKIYKTFFIEPNEDNTDSTKQIHIMEVARLLYSLKITDYSELKPAGRARFKITFPNPRNAEQLINSRILKETYKYKIYVPNMYKQTIGVIRNIPPTIPDEELLANLSSQNIPIVKVERIFKLDRLRNNGKEDQTLLPTYSVKIFVDGEKLPTEVKVYGVATKVDVYIFPLKFCWRCSRYGHKIKACKSQQPRCCNCSMSGHDGADCKSLNILCIHCKEPHRAFNVDCRERQRQDRIRQEMAYNKLTFAEAEKIHPHKSDIQLRLNSTTEFPQLPNTQYDSARSQ